VVQGRRIRRSSGLLGTIWVGHASYCEKTSVVRIQTDGLLMEPLAVPRLLDRHGVALRTLPSGSQYQASPPRRPPRAGGKTHSFFEDTDYLAQDFSHLSQERNNPNGGPAAPSHLFGAIGARDLSQTVRELVAMLKGSWAVPSVCADGDEGTAENGLS